MRKAIFLSLFFMMVIGLTSAPVFADTIQYTFSSETPAAGQVTSLGGGQFSGSGIDIDFLEIDDLSTANLLDLYMVTGPVNGDGSLDFNTQAHSFSITGTELSLFGSDPALSGTLLSSNSFSFTPNGCGSSAAYCDIDFSGSSNLGSFSAFVMSGVIGDPAGGSWTAYSNGAMAPAATPEPASLALFGSGLACLGGALRRKIRK